MPTVTAFASITRWKEQDHHWCSYTASPIVWPVGTSSAMSLHYEALITLAYISSITNRVEMGTTVLATPTRNPIVLAREVATLDALSCGRMILGVGTGWIREELEAVGVPWAERGRFLDEAIEIMRVLWREEGPISYSGRYTSFRDMLFEPKPARKGGRRSGPEG